MKNDTLHKRRTKPERVQTRHVTPCGLSHILKSKERAEYDTHCQLICPIHERPFCYDEPDAVKCSQFHLARGWKPGAGMRTMIMTSAPPSIPGQLDLLP